MKNENIFIGMCFFGMTLIPSILSNVLDLELKFRIGLFIGFGLIVGGLLGIIKTYTEKRFTTI